VSPFGGVEACKLTPCGTPLRAASGRSQASAPVARRRPIPLSWASRTPASELAGSAVPQGCLPAQPAGPAGGPVALALLTRRGALGPALSSLDTFGITRRTRETRAQRVA